MRSKTIALIVFFIVPFARGADMTLDAALARARTGSPAVRAAESDVAAAQSDLAAASRLIAENPTLEAIAGPRRSDTGETTSSHTITVDQPLELFGRRGARIESARAALDAAMARRDVAVRDALADVAAAYIAAAAAGERAKVAARDEELAHAIEHIAQRRFDLGDVAIIDVNATKADAAEAHAETLAAEGERDAAVARLRALLGYAPDAPMTIATDLASIVNRSPPAVSVTPPEVRQAEAEVRQARAQVDVARAQARPDFGLAAEQAREENSNVIMAGGHITLPIFNRGQAGIRAAQERLRAAEARLEIAQRLADANRRAAMIELDRRRAAANVLTDTALPLLVDNERLTARSYETGEIDLAELLVLRRQTNTIRIAAINRLQDAAQAWVDLARATGALP